MNHQFLVHISPEEHRPQLPPRGGITKENVKAANLGGWSLSFTTMRQPIVGLLLTRIVWSKLQTTQCMCETKPSEIINK